MREQRGQEESRETAVSGSSSGSRKSPASILLTVLFCLIPLAYCAIAAALMYGVSRSGIYPAGSDVTYHIHRADLVCRGLVSGNFWPSYDPLWYNGVEILRYWPPLTAYLMGFFELIRGGDSFGGYLLFIGVLYLLDAFSWYIIGAKSGRRFLGAFFGAVWFFLPVNMFVLFGEGNLPRALSTAFVPLLLFAVMEYMTAKRWGQLIAIAVFMALTVLCHLGYGGMVALGLLVFLLLYIAINRKAAGFLDVVLALVFGFALTGIWLVPSLVGGISNVDSSETMAGFFQSLALSLNPVRHYEQGLIPSYFGLVGFLLACFGLLFSNRKSAPGFLNGILVCLFSSTAFYPIFKALPGGQYLWMMRFFSFGVCCISIGFIYWKSLKKWMIVLVCVLTVADSLPSLYLALGKQENIQPADRFDEAQQGSMVDEAKAITKQRLLAFNEGAGGVIDAYLLSNWGGFTPTVFGAGWEASNTAANIAQLNRAANESDYGYMFDRSLDMGADTVLVRLGVIRDFQFQPENVVSSLDAAASSCGYKLYDSSDYIRIYHLSGAPDQWGTTAKYKGIAIGSQAFRVALNFPVFREVSSTNLNDFTYDDLKDYEVIYLAGFTYDDQEAAEELILKLSEHGVRVVISADGIPENHSSHNRNFLGVTCDEVKFENGFPELDTIDGLLDTTLFPNDHREWNTVTLDGLTDVWGTVEDDGLRLPFYGTGKNSNLIYVGLNLTMYYELTGDEQIGRLLSHVMDLSGSELPERTVVPLTVNLSDAGMTIESPEDGVNTGIAWHDMFSSADGKALAEENHLLYVDEGKTVITFTYPYLWQGIALSLAGLVLLTAFAAFKKKAADTGSAAGPCCEEPRIGL